MAPRISGTLPRDLTTVYGVLNHIEDDLQSKDSAIKSPGEGRMEMLQSMTVNLKSHFGSGTEACRQVPAHGIRRKAVRRALDQGEMGGRPEKDQEIASGHFFPYFQLDQPPDDIHGKASGAPGGVLALTIRSSSLQRIETGLEEMRAMAKETSKAEPTDLGQNITATPILEAGEVEMDEDPFSTVESRRRVAEAGTPPISLPTVTENHGHLLSTRRLAPVVSLASDDFVEKIQELPHGYHLEIAEIVFSNCRLACFDFYFTHGKCLEVKITPAFGGTKYARDDPPDERKLFQMDDDELPQPPDGLELRDWLAMIFLLVHGRVSDPEVVPAQSILNYTESHQLFSKFNNDSSNGG
ncbi:hypothetical protein CLCR_01609 [Cladophialophora carrionii]|uniref:Uncharacterized protein n=1 Tax=Cladophialophora carrionii TaxID=86049 RepID=A0A1C1CAY8_9EURO|nr:hypothetical protein CLCR_01609 [Cladophialophora carrionii]